MDAEDPRFATRLVRKVSRSVLAEDVLLVASEVLCVPDVLLVLLEPEAP